TCVRAASRWATRWRRCWPAGPSDTPSWPWASARKCTGRPCSLCSPSRSSRRPSGGARWRKRNGNSGVIDEPAVDAATEAVGDGSERETLRERITVLHYAAMERIATRWPEHLGRAGFAAYARAMHAAAPKLRSTVAANMARILGPPPESEVVAAAVRE